MSDLSAADSNIPKEHEDELKKIALTEAFSDTLLHAIQLSARAMASDFTTRWNTWLHSWEVDLLAQIRVASIPFKGGHLFVKGMDIVFGSG